MTVTRIYITPGDLFSQISNTAIKAAYRSVFSNGTISIQPEGRQIVVYVYTSLRVKDVRLFASLLGPFLCFQNSTRSFSFTLL